MLPAELSLLALAGKQPPSPASAGARALHQLRRAEASLLSYERSAWAEETATTLRHRELRPAAERGPMLCFLDTSRSMAGRREAIAKAALLAILRQAESEKRRCHLFFFSGPGQLENYEVPPPPIPSAAWEQVLTFMAGTFSGGTDLEAPLTAGIARLQEEPSWEMADMLLITDGEVPPASSTVLDKLQSLRTKIGLRIFGLVVAEEEAQVGYQNEFSSLCDEWRRFEALGRVPLRWRPQEPSDV